MTCLQGSFRRALFFLENSQNRRHRVNHSESWAQHRILVTRRKSPFWRNNREFHEVFTITTPLA